MTNIEEITEYQAGFLVKEKYEDDATGEVKYKILIGKKEIIVYLSDINSNTNILKLARYGLDITQEEASETLRELKRQIRNPNLKISPILSRIGFIDNKYIHPYDNNIVIDHNNSEEGKYIDSFQVSGSVEEWREDIFDSFQDDAKAQFYICGSLASIMLKHFNVQPFILEIFGLTSTGKSTLVNIAASVWGTPNLVGGWNMTQNALDFRAAYANIFPLMLDDTQNAKEKQLKDIIYSFSSKKVRDRATPTGVQETRDWHNILLTSGEYSIFSIVSASGGAAARCISINMDAHNRSDEFYDDLYEAMKDNKGIIGYEFFKFYRNEINNPHNKLDDDYKAIVQKLRKFATNAVSKRLARAYAVIILAAEILIDYFGFTIDTEAFYDIFENISKENDHVDLVSNQLKVLLEYIDTERNFGKYYYLSDEGNLLLPVKFVNDFLNKNRTVIRK
ncbi:MAG: DUF927 domain-containing protein, partial [Lysinibacillus sp.]